MVEKIIGEYKLSSDVEALVDNRQRLIGGLGRYCTEVASRSVFTTDYNGHPAELVESSIEFICPPQFVIERGTEIDEIPPEVAPVRHIEETSHDYDPSKVTGHFKVNYNVGSDGQAILGVESISGKNEAPQGVIDAINQVFRGSNTDSPDDETSYTKIDV